MICIQCSTFTVVSLLCFPCFALSLPTLFFLFVYQPCSLILYKDFQPEGWPEITFVSLALCWGLQDGCQFKMFWWFLQGVINSGCQKDFFHVNLKGYVIRWIWLQEYDLFELADFKGNVFKGIKCAERFGKESRADSWEQSYAYCAPEVDSWTSWP